MHRAFYHRFPITASMLLLACVSLSAQTPKPAFERPAAQLTWTMQDSGTTASLRGIYSVDGKTAWASGTNGTVLKTTDSGAHWQKCASPTPDADTLDFRGVQAWDASSAIILAAGPGDKSRLYKTSDGCKTWKLVAQNENKEGFWDAIRLWTPTDGFLAGDPVDGHPFLSEFTSWNGPMIDNVLYGVKINKNSDSAFAASNSCIVIGPFRTENGAAREVWFATGGPAGSRVIHYQHFNGGEPERVSTSISDASMFPASPSGGIFSIAYNSETAPFRNVIATRETLIAVGGDYAKPNESAGTAAWSTDRGLHWTAAVKPPHGYRSSVAWSEEAEAWIAVGTNGSDISRDDGKTWQPLGDSGDGNWNALSLPFAVGPKGRIARLSVPKPD